MVTRTYWGVGACRRLQAHFTAPLAPYNLNDNECLRHADTKFTDGIGVSYRLADPPVCIHYLK